MFRIKICGVTNASDALAAAEAGADAIGLNFFSKSRRFVEIDAAREIAAALGRRATVVGVFVNHSADEIARTVEAVGLDAVQLHGDEPSAIIAALPRTMKIVRAFRCGREGLLPLGVYLEECRELGRVPDAVLIDADVAAEFGGTGERADWERIAADRTIVGGEPLILAGGLTPENVGDAIAAVQPDGVDVASGVESEPRRKDTAQVAAFIATARRAFERLSDRRPRN